MPTCENDRHKRGKMAGGEMGIRTPDRALWPYTRLAGERLQPARPSLHAISTQIGMITKSTPELNPLFHQPEERPRRGRELGGPVTRIRRRDRELGGMKVRPLSAAWASCAPQRARFGPAAPLQRARFWPAASLSCHRRAQGCAAARSRRTLARAMRWHSAVALGVCASRPPASGGYFFVGDCLSSGLPGRRAAFRRAQATRLAAWSSTHSAKPGTATSV